MTYRIFMSNAQLEFAKAHKAAFILPAQIGDHCRCKHKRPVLSCLISCGFAEICRNSFLTFPRDCECGHNIRIIQEMEVPNGKQK